MANKELLKNIKSEYILKYIFDYIKDTYFPDKLFLFSKKFQQKLNLKLTGLKEKYLKRIGFDLNNYLISQRFEKDLLTKEYLDFLKLKNINKEKLESIIFDIYEYKKIKDLDDEEIIDKIKDYEILISIYSPLFKIL